jgi:hypothetical protein
MTTRRPAAASQPAGTVSLAGLGLFRYIPAFRAAIDIVEAVRAGQKRG